MLKVIFNQDGSINTLEFNSYVTQGSHGEIDSLKLATKVNNLDLTDYTVVAVCKLPNGHTSAIEMDSTDDSGYRYCYLSEVQTYYAGTLLVSIEISDENDNTLFSFHLPITINPTAYETEGVTDNVTNAQYVDLIKKWSKVIDLGDRVDILEKLEIKQYDTYAEANADRDNLEVGQLLFVYDRNFFYKVTSPTPNVKSLSSVSEPAQFLLSRANASVTSGTIDNSVVLQKLLNNPGSIISVELATMADPVTPSFVYFTYANRNSSTERYFERIDNGIKKTITINASTGEWTYEETDIKEHLYEHIISFSFSTGSSGAPYSIYTGTILNTSATKFEPATNQELYDLINQHKPILVSLVSGGTIGGTSGILTTNAGSIYFNETAIATARLNPAGTVDKVKQIF